MIDTRESARKLFLNVVWYSGLAPLLSPMLSGLGAILMLHRVNREPATSLGINSHLTVTPEFLDAVLAAVRRGGYALVSMDEAAERLERGGGQGRFVAITLDDGYLDNLTDALPVFEAHEAPFTIYVAPALTEGRVELWWEIVEQIVCDREWLAFDAPSGRVSLDCSSVAGKIAAVRRLHDVVENELEEGEQLPFLEGLRRGGVPCSRIMSWDDVRTVARHRLGSIGAHTIHHYNLKRLPAAAARDEIVASGRIIELETGIAPVHFAYPYGSPAAVGPREVELAREAGYRSAVTTFHGVLQAGHAEHLHALPRLSVNGRYQRERHLRTMLSGVTTIANSRRRLVTV